MLAKINTGNPPVFHILKPLFVITIVAGVEVKHVFAYEDKFVNALRLSLIL